MNERSILCETDAEERANSLSHGVGVLLALVGTAVMLHLAMRLSGLHVIGVTVFGMSLVLLYAASTWYHSVTTPRAKALLQVLDHALIFVLIAGSYTPWLLVNLRGKLGWIMLAVIWGLAIGGIVLKMILLPRFNRLGVALYVVMGWMVCFVLQPLVAATNATAVAWLVAGGLFYTGGIVFYLKESLRYGHFVWHLFVMAGSLCHIIAVVTGVLV